MTNVLTLLTQCYSLHHTGLDHSHPDLTGNYVSLSLTNDPYFIKSTLFM